MIRSGGNHYRCTVAQTRQMSDKHKDEIRKSSVKKEQLEEPKRWKQRREDI